MRLLQPNRKQSILFFKGYLIALILTSIGYLDIPIFREYRYIIEPLIFLFLSILSFFMIIKLKGFLSITIFEFFFLLFICYNIISGILSDSLEVSSLARMLFTVILYYCLKAFISATSVSAYSYVLFWYSALLLLLYLLTLIYHGDITEETINNLFTPNKSIFAILLGSQIVFVLPIYFDHRKQLQSVVKFSQRICFIVIGLILFLLAITNGRAGWIGFILAIFYIIYQYTSNVNIKKRIFWSGILFFPLIFPLMLLYKSDSSRGRLLIYKISAGIFKDNWLSGIGQGQFKVRYNEYQAAWFASNDIYSKEAMLADNSFFAFNDFFQLLIENGVIGGLLMGFAIIFLMLQIKKTYTSSDNKHLVVGSIASLICITTGSLFSYPLRILPITIQAVICVAIINSYSTQIKSRVLLSALKTQLLKMALLLVNILLLIFSYFLVQYKVKAHEAFELSRIGFKRKAIEKYNSLGNSFIYDGNIMYLYAKELYYTGQLPEAMKILQKVKGHYCTNEIYRLCAQIAAELKDYKQAEKDFQTAIYMVPNRMSSRFDLLEYYLGSGDTANAIYWAKSILNMPVKVPSQVSKDIQRKTEDVLRKLQSTIHNSFLLE